MSIIITQNKIRKYRSDRFCSQIDFEYKSKSIVRISTD